MNISVDLTPDQIRFLEKMVETGEYRSRSEVLRDIIRRVEFEWAWKKGMLIASRKGDSEDIEIEREAAFQVLRKRLNL